MTTALEDDFATLACRALHRLGPEQRRRLFPLLEPQRVRAGSFLYRSGNSPGLFVLLSGEVLLSAEPGHRLARRMRIVERGGTFGELAHADGQPAPEAARA